MRTLRGLVICVVLAGLVGVTGVTTAGQDAAGAQFVGTWSGTWEGADAGGGFELTIDTKDGVTGGRVSVTGEPTYTATFAALSFDGNKMTARYDFPAAEGAEIVLLGTFEGSRVTGTWSAREKASGTEAVSGTWSATRK
ncbi:MAG: hypothetical protein V7647_3313 [Acidobacteriota bacterium]|jgi:hypothetical protein